MTALRPLVFLLTLLGSGTLFAHGGEDHSEPHPEPVAISSLPKIEATSDAFELLGNLNGTALTLYLDDTDTGTPVTGASMEISHDQHVVKASEIRPGQYQADVPWLAGPALYPLVFSIETADLADLLEGKLDTRNTAPQTDNGNWFSRWRNRLAGATPAASTTATTTASEIPRRLPDGRLFVPKSTQHLLGIRTERVRPQTRLRTLSLNGHVIADPGASGVVQAGQSGRLEPGPDGLPAPGQPVSAGQVLAWLAPLANSLERGNQEAALADLDSQLALAQKRQQRLDGLVDSVPQKDIEAARQEVVSLRLRRTALADSLYRKEALRAPVAGVIGVVDMVVGQVVSAGTSLFSVIQPDRLWVEALSYDPGLTLQPEGAVLQAGTLTAPLAYIGASSTLRDQALPLHFRILPPVPPLAIGQQVRVLAPTAESRHGIAVPAASMARGADGQPMLWVRESAEIFRPVTVTTEALDGQRLLVTSGLADGSRVVADGAASLGQIR